MADSLPPWNRTDFWEAHFEDGVLPWDIGRVSPTLVELSRRIGMRENSTILVPGAGAGHDALHFAREGHSVSAIDWSKSAVDEIRARARKEDIPIEVLRSSFFEVPESWNETFAFLLEHTFFCAIDPDDRQNYVHQAATLLEPGGQVFGVFFVSNDFERRSILGKSGEGLGGGPPFWSTEAEVRSLFEERFEIRLLEPSPFCLKERPEWEWWGHFIRKA